MVFKRGQTQVLYRFLPGSIFEHDDYGFCRVTAVELREERVNEKALANALTDMLSQWPEESFRDAYADPRDARGWRGYVVGTPAAVRFEPYPTLLECRSCKRVFRVRDFRTRRPSRPGRCPECSGVLGQIRYTQAHNCGRMEELYYRTCPRHGSANIWFQDTGRVATARWMCGACGGREIGNLRMTPCNCAYSTRAATNKSERYLRTLPVTDPAVYLTHVVPFINFDEDREQQLSGDPEITALLLARTWDLLSDLPEVIQRRHRGRGRDEQDDQTDGIVSELARQLETLDPENPLIGQWRERQQQAAQAPGQEAVDRVKKLLGARGDSLEKENPPRQFVEHVAILDTLSTTTTQIAAGWALERGDAEGAENLEQAGRLARDELGIAELRVINDFPAALCAAGYTRITRDPTRSILTPFEADGLQNKIPLYVVASETEGVLFRLAPTQVASWLVDNAYVDGPAPEVEAEAWAWLYANASGLLNHRWESESGYHEAPAVAVRTLLHTISHALLRHAEWSGFSANSIGEYLLPGTLSCVIYANRYAETKIGGLTALFEQRLGQWLTYSVNSARECVYDPFCTDEGGSCAGCLHREYNCPTFNHELSRAVLYGGPTPEADSRAHLGLDFIERGYWQHGRFSGLAGESAVEPGGEPEG